MTAKAKSAPQSATSSKKSKAAVSLNPPTATRQVAFYQLLVGARKKWFIDALGDALGQLEQATVKAQVGEYVPAEAQKILAVAGLRDEYVFPVPAVLEVKPSLVGYYRMLVADHDGVV